MKKMRELAEKDVFSFLPCGRKIPRANSSVHPAMGWL
jgi:hypothetical protein